MAKTDRDGKRPRSIWDLLADAADSNERTVRTVVLLLSVGASFGVAALVVGALASSVGGDGQGLLQFVAGVLGFGGAALGTLGVTSWHRGRRSGKSDDDDDDDE